MADLKPLGSEKLKGDDKLRRILELTYYNSNATEQKPTSAEYLSETKVGTYGIVKEKDGYYVKRGLTESTLDYIGGMFMKNKNRFRTYAEALKRLELLKGEELLQEDTKYMLKINRPKPSTDTAEAVPPAPVAQDTAPMAPPAPDAPVPGAEPAPEDMGPESPDDMGNDNEDDFLKGIQKLTGKLGEKLRDNMDQLESDDLKYVLNSVISAIDLKKLDDTDKDEVVSQLEGDDETGDEDMGSDSSMDTPDMGGAEVPPSDNGDKELGEMGGLEELINTPFDFNDDEDKPYGGGGEVDELLTFPKGVDVLNIGQSSDEESPDLGDEPINPEDDFDSDEDLSEPTSDDSESTEEDVCSHCKGTGVIRGKECPTCNGEGVVAPEILRSKEEPNANIPLSSEDLFDDDPGYDPSEMGEEYTAEEVPVPDDSADIKSKEIELNELTDMINNTVKETLGKYFE